MNKSELQPIEQEVKKHLVQQFGSANVSLVVGVSGGPDSMALLHILSRLDSDPFVVHINYEKRQEQADKDQLFVENIADSWGLSCRSFKVGSELDASLNFQAQARDIRYKYFERIRQQEEARTIAVAHHEDDQLETILHKVLRGAGMEAWSGMSVYQNGIFRPLLQCSQKEISSYVKACKIPHRIDESNRKSVYARNFLRNEWIPQLNHWFPGWRENILRLADRSEEYGSVVDELIKVAEEARGALNRAMVIRWSEEVRKVVFLRLIKKIHSDISVSKSALNQLDKLDELQTGQSLQLSDNLYVQRDRKILELVTEINAEPDQIAVTINQNDIEHGSGHYANWWFEITSFQSQDFAQSLYLDIQKLNWPLTLRVWKPGDRFQPFGMKGTQKVKDHLTNRKISSSRKSNARVLEDGQGNIIAVLYPPDEKKQPGMIADFMKCDRTTQEALEITQADHGHV